MYFRLRNSSTSPTSSSTSLLSSLARQPHSKSAPETIFHTSCSLSPPSAMVKAASSVSYSPRFVRFSLHWRLRWALHQHPLQVRVPPPYGVSTALRKASPRAPTLAHPLWVVRRVPFQHPQGFRVLPLTRVSRARSWVVLPCLQPLVRKQT